MCSTSCNSNALTDSPEHLCTEQSSFTSAADPRRAFSARRRKDEDYSTFNSSSDAVNKAQVHGLLDLRCCSMSTLPADMGGSLTSRPIRVLDARFVCLRHPFLLDDAMISCKRCPPLNEFNEVALLAKYSSCGFQCHFCSSSQWFTVVLV